MKMKWIALAVAAAIPAAAMAIGGASGPKIDYEVQGHIGEVMGNPYGIAPLTAVIRDGGYTLADVTVHIVPKQGGQKISYKVSRSQLLTHGGVPIFGLYPDYLNTIRVDYTRIDTTGKKEKFSDEYKLHSANIGTDNIDFCSSVYHRRHPAVPQNKDEDSMHLDYPPTNSLNGHKNKWIYGHLLLLPRTASYPASNPASSLPERMH